MKETIYFVLGGIVGLLLGLAIPHGGTKQAQLNRFPMQADLPLG